MNINNDKIQKYKINNIVFFYDFSGGLDVCTMERGNAAMVTRSLSSSIRTLGTV